MINRNNKKGFTIVELVIVIAVIAILAAVLIPTFAGIIKKAHESSDTQLVKNLNTALATDTADHPTMQSALDAAAEFGYDLDKIVTKVPDNDILWDSVNDVFVYLKDGEVTRIPDDESDKVVLDYQYWQIVKEIPETAKYSLYAGDEFTDADGVVEVSVGFDAGKNTGINVKYTNTSGTAQSVVLRTNGGTHTINAPLDDVAHYGTATSINVIAIAPDSLHIFGSVGYVEIASGHIVAETGSAINTLVVTGSDVIADNNGGTVAAAYTTVTGATGNITLESYNGNLEDLKEIATLFAGGNGKEADPYIVATQDQWNRLSKSTNVLTQGAFFKITTDITLDADFSCIKNATGTFDFDGNTLYVTKATPESNWIDYARNVSIKNLNIDSETDFALMNSAMGDIRFENIKTFGKIDVGSSNNSALYIQYPGYNMDGDYLNVIFVSCDNYADITGRGGYVGAYLGSMQYSYADMTVSMINCANFGSIVNTAGKGAAMIVSNPSGGWGDSETLNYRMYLSNVRNYGVISAPEKAGLVMSNVGKGGMFEDAENWPIKDPDIYEEKRTKLYFYADADFKTLIVDENGNRVKLNGDITPEQIDIKNAGTGINATVTYAELTVKDDDTFDFSTVLSGNAVRYEVSFAFNGVYGAANGAADAHTFNLTADEIGTAKIYAYEWLNKIQLVDKDLPVATGEIVEHNEYGLTYYTCGDNYVFSREGCTIRKQPKVVVYAYNEAGDVINIAIYEYPSN